MNQRVPILTEAGPSTADDMKLAAEVLSKDRKATAEFVELYTDCVYSYVRRRVMPRPEPVEDLVQEILLTAWQGLANFRGEASLRQWVLGIARHKVEDYYRKRLREPEQPGEDDDWVEELTVVPMYEEALDQAALQEKTNRVLASLPETYCLALHWRYLENRSARDMAQLTGKTEKAIERLLARAREQFRRRWSYAEPSRG